MKIRIFSCRNVKVFAYEGATPHPTAGIRWYVVFVRCCFSDGKEILNSKTYLAQRLDERLGTCSIYLAQDGGIKGARGRHWHRARPIRAVNRYQPRSKASPQSPLTQGLTPPANRPGMAEASLHSSLVSAELPAQGPTPSRHSRLNERISKKSTEMSSLTIND